MRLGLRARTQRPAHDPAGDGGRHGPRAQRYSVSAQARRRAFAISAFVEATDNFSIAVFFADTRAKTVPIAAYEQIRDVGDPTLATTATMLILVVLALEKAIGCEKLIRHG